MPALEARGISLSWSERGSGRPALLIHETALTSAAWEPVADELAAAGARAIAYDRRGWGDSTVPDGYRRTTISEQSEDAAELLSEAAGAPALLAGAGTGAVIALDLLLRRPELVAGAVLVEPPLLALVPSATEALSSDLNALAQGSDRGSEALVRLYLSGGLGALGAGAERLPAELTAPAQERPASLIAELGSVAAWDMPLPRLADAERPSAIVTSDATPGLVRQSSAALASRLNGGQVLHVASPSEPAPPHLAEPRRIAEAILSLA